MLKRIALWALALLALSGVACASTVYCVNAPGLATLVDAGGRELIDDDGVQSIFTVREDALYAGGSRGAYRLYDAAGQPLGDVTFEMIDDAGESLVFRSGGLYGAMDASGAVLIPARWRQLTSDGEGGWLALDDDPLDEQPDELIHIAADGAERATGVLVMGGLNPVSCGRMPFMNGEGLYGATDASGSVAIEALWQYVGPFENGVARVTGPEGMGLIDVNGRTLIAPTYRYMECGASMVAAYDGSGVDVYPPQGGPRRFRLSGPVDEVALVGSYLYVSGENGARLYDGAGKLLVEGGTGTTYVPGNRGQLIASDGAWGERCQWLVNPNGSAASGRFQQLLPLCPGRYAYLEMEGRNYYSAELGSLQTSWNYDGARYGLVNGSGRVLLSAIYREIQALDAQRLLLIGEGEVTLANRDGVPLKTWLTAEIEAPSDEAAE